MRLCKAVLFSFLLLSSYGATATSQDFKRYQWGALSFDIPADWEVTEGDGAISASPREAHLKLDNGQDWITHGLFVHWATISDSPMMACPQVERVMTKYFPGLRPVTDCRYTSIPGVPNETVGYDYTNASVRGHEESGRIVLVRRGVGYVVFMLFSPTKEAVSYAPIFNRVLSSITFQKQSSGAQARTPERTVVGETTSSEQTIVRFTSEPTHAEIMIDGKFVGTTPSEVQISSGQHEVVFWKNGYKVTRKALNTRGGSISVYADLDRDSQ